MSDHNEIRRVAAEVLLQMMTEDTTGDQQGWLQAKDFDQEDYKQITEVAGSIFLAYIRDATVKAVKQLHNEDGDDMDTAAVTEALENSIKDGAGAAANLGFRIGFAVAERRMMEPYMGGSDE